MIISFGWTAQYLPPDGPKDTTRRIWKDRTLKSWERAGDEGRLTHDAGDKCLACGGRTLGKITHRERPFLEPLWLMKPEELNREGGMCNSVREFCDLYFGGDGGQAVAVVRFHFEPHGMMTCVENTKDK